MATMGVSFHWCWGVFGASQSGGHTGLWTSQGLSHCWHCGQAGQLAVKGCLSWHLSPQGLAVLVLFCVLNEEVWEAWKLACLSKKGQSEEATRSTQVGKSRAAQGAGLQLPVWDRS